MLAVGFERRTEIQSITNVSNDTVTVRHYVRHVIMLPAASLEVLT